MNQQFAGLILTALNEGGTGLLEDESRFRAYLKDLNDGIVYEHDLDRYMKMCDARFLSYFSKCADGDNDQIDLACRESAAYLSQDGFFDPGKAREVSASLAFALKQYKGLPESDPFEEDNAKREEAEKKRLEEEEKKRLEEEEKKRLEEEEKKRLEEEEKKRREEEEKKRREEEEKKRREEEEKKRREEEEKKRRDKEAWENFQKKKKKSARTVRRLVFLVILAAAVFAGDWYARKNLGESIFTKSFVQKVTSGEIIDLVKKTVQKQTETGETEKKTEKTTEKETTRVTEKETQKVTEKETQKITEKETRKVTEKETLTSASAPERKGTMYSRRTSPQAQTENQAVETDLDYSNPAVIYEVQSALNARSYNCGSPDGIAGRKTKEAVSQYKKSVGLEESSEITQDLLDSLEISMTLEDMTVHPASMAADIDNLWVYDQSDSTKSDVLIYYENSEKTRGGLFSYYSDGKKLSLAYALGPMESIGQVVKITDDTDTDRNYVRITKTGATTGVQGDIHINDGDDINCDMKKDTSLSYKNYVIERVGSYVKTQKKISELFN